MPPRTLTSDRSTAPRRSAHGTTRGSGPTTIALANQKGGVAKTTSVASIGAALAELGRRVLLVDLDPQACLTFSLGVDPDTVERSIHDVLTGRAEVGDVVVTCEEGVDLVPSTIDLAGAEAHAPAATRVASTSCARPSKASTRHTTSCCSTARRASGC